MAYRVFTSVAMIGIVCLASSLAACGQERPGREQQEDTVPERTIEAVLKEHTGRLMSLPRGGGDRPGRVFRTTVYPGVGGEKDSGSS